MNRYIFNILLLLVGPMVFGQELKENISVHDPVMIKQQDTYYLFCTGRGISVWSSKDMKHWKAEEPVFTEAPEWAVKAISGFRNHIWAPDISFYKEKYYLYYSVSAFGKNTSAIGIATNKTLNPKDPDFLWVDHGEIIQSVPGQTNFNAIDPNLVTDKQGNPYLAFGSFWSGLKLAKLTADRLHVDEDIKSLTTIASRKENKNLMTAGGNAIEAPFVFKKKGWFYLFASIDYCCKGPESTYKMIMGRAKNINGPYLDKKGVEMSAGGGSLLLEGDSNWYGVGHNAICTFDGVDYLIFHGYDASDKGKSKLRIEKLKWDSENWPAVN